MFSSFSTQKIPVVSHNIPSYPIIAPWMGATHCPVRCRAAAAGALVDTGRSHLRACVLAWVSDCHGHCLEVRHQRDGIRRENGGLIHQQLDFWLVVTGTLGLFVPYFGNFIISTDELICFRGLGIPPTRICMGV